MEDNVIICGQLICTGFPSVNLLLSADAFRETLDAFDIQGPRVDWNDVRVAPGFSVWKWKQFTLSSKSAWQHGYEQPSTVENILAVTDPLLEGKEPSGELESIKSKDNTDLVQIGLNEWKYVNGTPGSGPGCANQ